MIDTYQLRMACMRMFEGWTRPTFQMCTIKEDTLEKAAYEFYFLNIAGCKEAGVSPEDLIYYYKTEIL